MNETLSDATIEAENEEQESEAGHLDESTGLESDVKSAQDDTLDYEAIIKEDIDTLRAIFPELHGIRNITDLENPMRYAALRDLGLSAEEAYLATTPKRRTRDNRSHLLSGVPRSASAHTTLMSESELETARQIFSGLSDSEIKKLYKKVTK